MNIDSLRDFIFAMKTANKKQNYGCLFFLDEETNELYACALGQGLLQSGEISEEDARTFIKTDQNAEFLTISTVDGRRTGRYSRKLEDTWDSWIRKTLGARFRSFVVSKNDSTRTSVLDIALAAYDNLEKFK